MAPAPGADDRPADGAAPYRALFHQSGVPQALVSTDGVIAAVNEATCELFDRTPEELVGEPLLERLPVDGRGRDQQLFAQVVSGGLDRAQFERRLDHRDGRRLDTLVSVAAVRGGTGEVIGISVCLQDITALKAAQRETEQAGARWRSLSQNVSDVALITDAALVVAYVSPPLTKLLGHREEALLGVSLLDLVHPADRDRVEAATQHFVRHGPNEFTVDYRIENAGGQWRQVTQHVVNLLDDPDVRGLVLNLRDQTEQHELRDSLRRVVLQDRLTGLPNRSLLMDRVQQAIERSLSSGGRYSLLFVNLDGLRAINDTFGQAAGDQVLRSTADTLSALVRPADTVARYDGDQLAVLLDAAGDDAEVEGLARRIAAALDTVLALPGALSVHVSACVGVAHGPAGSADALVSLAEAATFRAKTLGRGRVHVLETGAQQRLADQRRLGAELAVAVAQEQLSVHYQPIVELSTGTIAGFEALVRWQHPVHGMIGPDVFLPLAASLDLLESVDEWVLAQACAAATTWPATASGPVSVAVNVAPSHLTSPGFAGNVERALEVSGLPATSLVLEVTETAVVADLAAAEHVLGALSALGVGVSIDDFGTGYSSMLQLRQLPFDKLKIDREFVRGLPQSLDDIAICSSVVNLARRIGVRSIAEGVETGDQAAALAKLGCELGQGFLWSPAVGASAARHLLDHPHWRPSPPMSGLPVPSAHGLNCEPGVFRRCQELHDGGASLHTIAASLNRDGLRTATGRRWHPATVARLLYEPPTAPRRTPGRRTG